MLDRPPSYDQKGEFIWDKRSQRLFSSRCSVDPFPLENEWKNKLKRLKIKYCLSVNKPSSYEISIEIQYSSVEHLDTVGKESTEHLLAVCFTLHPQDKRFRAGWRSGILCTDEPHLGGSLVQCFQAVLVTNSTKVCRRTIYLVSTAEHSGLKSDALDSLVAKLTLRQFSMCVCIRSGDIDRTPSIFAHFFHSWMSVGENVPREQLQIFPYMELGAECWHDELRCWVYGFLNSFVSISLSYKTSGYVLVFTDHVSCSTLPVGTNQLGLNEETGRFTWGYMHFWGSSLACLLQNIVCCLLRLYSKASSGIEDAPKGTGR